MKKILIIQTASIGDVILSTPVLEKLHAVFPDSQIDFLLKRGNESLFLGHPFIHQLFVWNKKGHKYKNLWRIIKQIRKNRYDLAVNLQRFASTGFITAGSRASKTIGFNKNPLSLCFTVRKRHIISDSQLPVHEVYRNLKLVEDFGNSDSFPVKLYPSQNDYAWVSQYKTSQYICIAPASLWFTKQYPEAKWVEFLKELDPNLHIYFLGGNEDSSLCNHIIGKSGHAFCLNLAGKLSFLQTAALMKDALMNYTNDSAPLHLASAVDAPVTAIFCSTVPAFGFGPLSGNSQVIEVKEELYCRPCGLHGHRKCPEKHFKCAMNIPIQRLIERLN